MSIDLDGNVYDYLNALSDLRNEVLRITPLNNFDVTFRDDPDRIIRFFRFLGKFENTKYQPEALIYIKKYVSGLSKLSDKRKQRELEGILSGHNPDKIIKMMCDAGADKYLPIKC